LTRVLLERDRFEQVGLLLLMFAIVPNEASQPPTPWKRVRERAIAGDDDAASIQRPASDS
jgi:hypothetical protein